MEKASQAEIDLVVVLSSTASEAQRVRGNHVPMAVELRR